MPNFTKQAIRDSFIKLISEKPLDKITVKEIVEDCEITRRTFYYHYQDIYALVEDLFLMEAEKVIKEYNAPDKWEEAFIAAGHFVLDNKKAIHNIYKSVHREELERYIDKITGEVMKRYIDAVSEGINASKEDKRLIGDFYKCALEGIVKKWLEEGMKDDPEDAIRRLGKLFNGNIKQSLERSASEA